MLGITNSYQLTASIFVVVLAIASVVSVISSCRKLAPLYGADVRLVWYLYALAMFCTLLVAFWASNTGAVDAAGRYHGAAGAVIQSILEFVVDLKSDLTFLAVLIAIVLVPQLVSYLISGLFGCGAVPILVGFTFRFVFWSIVKTLAVFAAVTPTLSLYAWVRGWPDMSLDKASLVVSTSIILLAGAFAMIEYYRNFDDLVAFFNQPLFARPRRVLRRIDRWANRRVTPPERRG